MPMRSSIERVLIAVLVTAALLVPVYIVASIAYDRTTDLRARAVVSQAREERYLTTVHSVLTNPTSYADVPIDFAYSYQKSDHRVRVVVSLPQGYLFTVAETNADTAMVEAYDVMPTWAMTTDPLYAVTTGTYNAFAIGIYGWFEGVTDIYAIMTLTNSNGYPQGSWSIRADHGAIEGDGVWLGVNMCGFAYNDTACLPDVIGEMVFYLTSSVDIAAWNARFDAA